MNGENGIWAQELYDRGFDDSQNGELLPPKWSLIPSSVSNAVIVKSGGYNENGVNSILINSISDGESGVQQTIYLDSKVAHEFYIYLKNCQSETSKFALKILDKFEYSVLYESELTISEPEWQKYIIDVPQLFSSTDVIVQLLLKDKGCIELDEASLMPVNNVSGVRKEFYDLFVKWRPGIIRYPGGFFADMEIAHFEYAIGPIDKRKSPMKSWEGHYQRMDFGVNEFIKFCNSINAEPHIVVNLLNGTAEEAANYVEYCNGLTTSIYGALRVRDGSVAPYNVKYWEIGNEQWTDKEWMIPRYNLYADAMLDKDPNLKLIINGDVWQGKSYFDACMSRTTGRCHNYGWHYSTYALPKDDNYKDEERYQIVMGGMDEMQRHINEYENWLIQDNYFPQSKQSITEHLIMYRIAPRWIDTNSMNASLEAGLLESGFLMNFLNSSNTFELYEKTFGLGHIRTGRNSKNERVIYPTVLHNVLSFMRNHTGDNVYSLNIVAPKYNTVFLDGMFQLFDIPLINTSLSTDSNYNYLYVLNKSYNDTLCVELDSQLTALVESSLIYDLTASSNKIYHTPDNPNFIDFKKVESDQGRKLIIPPFTVRCYISHKTTNIEKPNPDDIRIFVANRKLYISGIDYRFNTFNYSIFSIIGDELNSFEIHNNKLEQYCIDLGAYQSGIYLLRIIIDGKVFFKKIII